MSFDLILFGGTGDLTWRKLIPALFQAYRHGSLPPDGRIIGIGRQDLSSQAYRANIKERFENVEDSGKRPSTEEFERFSSLLSYLRVDLANPDQYQQLADNIKKRAADTVVIYLATSPTLFPTIAEQLRLVGLNAPHIRIVLEKPLGHDLASNLAINKAVKEGFCENQIFRIDHYLGKPAVQNLFALRFGNTLFEPLWRREYISNIQITIAEKLGVEKRGAFYDETGALRDMIQNHALQLLCAIAMEPPISLNADHIRDEKLKVLCSLRPWTEQNLSTDTVRGQYTSSPSQPQEEAYRAAPGVKANSNTETFVALRTEIKNWRWAGVPFYLRTGKRMAETRGSIVVNFHPIPHAIFGNQYNAPNSLVIHLQPKDGLELHLQAQESTQGIGSGQPLTPVQLDLDFNGRFGADRVGGYERLLLDVLAGRLNLFVRSDEQEAAWRWVEPLMTHWQRDSQGPKPYASGSWGPSSANTMIAKDGFCWSESC